MQLNPIAAPSADIVKFTDLVEKKVLQKTLPEERAVQALDALRRQIAQLPERTASGHRDHVDAQILEKHNLSPSVVAKALGTQSAPSSDLRGRVTASAGG